MDKFNFIYVYYFPSSSAVHVKVIPSVTNSNCIDISEVWRNKDLLDMLYPGVGKIKGIWENYELTEYTVACHVSNIGVLLWNQSTRLWERG